MALAKDFQRVWSNIDETTVAGAPRFPDIQDNLVKFLGSHVAMCHTAFDRLAIMQACKKYGLPAPGCHWLDSSRVARKAWEQVAKRGYGLCDLCALLGYRFNHHDALENAKAAAYIFIAAIQKSGKDVDGWLRRVGVPVGACSGRRRSRCLQLIFWSVVSPSREREVERATHRACVPRTKVNQTD